MIYPENFENKIEFNRIKSLIKELCISDLGKEKVDSLSLILNQDKLEKELSKTDEFKVLLLKYDDFPVNNYFDARFILKKTKLKGSVIEIHELFTLKKSLDTIKAIIRFFKNHKDEFPNLQKISSDIKIYDFVINRINAIVTNSGKIKDNASTELNIIRNEIRIKKNNISKILNSVMSEIKSNAWLESDLSASIVNGRTVVPIDTTHKRKIKGLIHDVSASGKTTYIEPEQVVELNNQIIDLEQNEKLEIYKILKLLTEEISPYSEDLIISYDFLAEIDFIRAKAKFAIQIDAIKPGISDKKIISLNKARHPLLFLKFKKQNREVVPLNIEINENQRIILISGPNAGGKSIALKTVVLLQYMFQNGLLIPVGGGSDLGIFKKFFIDIGDEQSLENDLSTYSSHLFNMKYFLKNSDNDTLIFIDEFGTGTEPLLGGAIAESVLEELNNKKPFGVITTHYTNLKHFAAFAEGIVNAAMLFDTGKIEPVYKLDTGKPGSSFSFETARKIGLPENVLKKAEQKAGKQNIEFDKHLRQLLRDKHYWEEKRYQIKSKDNKLERILEKYEKELSEIKKTKKEIISKAKAEAELIVKNANKEIEKTIREIKKANAEKEKTKQIRQEFEQEKQKLVTNKKSKDFIDKKLNEITRKTGKKVNKKDNNQTEDTQINEKDKVILISNNTVGEVLKVDKKNIVVAFGNIITTVPKDKVKKISNNEHKRIAKNRNKSSLVSEYTMNKRLNFTPNIDIRGERVEDAIMRVTKFIDEAIMLGYSELKILHGTGTGALKHAIRQYLSTLEFVKSTKDERIEFGGAGITIVELDYD